jgi:hypothetical protein
MSDSTIETEAGEVPFSVYDFSMPIEQLQAQGLKPGFYYSIPTPPEETTVRGEIFLEGPFATVVKACDAAKAFIAETLASYVQEAA